MLPRSPVSTPREGAERQPGTVPAYGHVQRGGDQRKPPQRRDRGWDKPAKAEHPARLLLSRDTPKFRSEDQMIKPHMDTYGLLWTEHGPFASIRVHTSSPRHFTL